MVVFDLTMSASSSTAALDLLKQIAGACEAVAAEITSKDRSLICKVSGVLSLNPSGEELRVTGSSGGLAIELYSVSSCSCDEALCRSPASTVEAGANRLDVRPFAAVLLTNGAHVAFRRKVVLR